MPYHTMVFYNTLYCIVLVEVFQVGFGGRLDLVSFSRYEMSLSVTDEKEKIMGTTPV